MVKLEFENRIFEGLEVHMGDQFKRDEVCEDDVADVLKKLGLDVFFADDFCRTVFTSNIFLWDDVGGKKASDVAEQIQLLNELNKPINLFINSLGGSAGAALGIYDLIKSVHVPTFTIALGDCKSAGLIIFLGGKKRLAGPYTRFMIHPSKLDSDNLSAGGKIADGEEQKRLNVLVEDIVKRETKIPFNSNLERDLCFGAKEAFQWKVIDDLWCLPKDDSKLKKRFGIIKKLKKRG